MSALNGNPADSEVFLRYKVNFEKARSLTSSGPLASEDLQCDHLDQDISNLRVALLDVQGINQELDKEQQKEVRSRMMVDAESGTLNSELALAHATLAQHQHQLDMAMQRLETETAKRQAEINKITSMRAQLAAAKTAMIKELDDLSDQLEQNRLQCDVAKWQQLELDCAVDVAALKAKVEEEEAKLQQHKQQREQIECDGISVLTAEDISEAVQAASALADQLAKSKLEHACLVEEIKSLGTAIMEFNKPSPIKLQTEEKKTSGSLSETAAMGGHTPSTATAVPPALSPMQQLTTCLQSLTEFHDKFRWMIGVAAQILQSPALSKPCAQCNNQLSNVRQSIEEAKGCTLSELPTACQTGIDYCTDSIAWCHSQMSDALGGAAAMITTTQP